MRQIVLGLIPLVLIAVVSLVLLGQRLGEARAPLLAATAEAEATVTGTGLGASGRQISVEYVDGDGQQQTARLTADRVVDVPLGELITVAYDPERPGVVYAPGDETTASVNDLVNGLLVVGVLLVVAVVTTLVRLLRRRGLTRREPQQVRVHREKYRRGLVDRSWLVVRSEDLVSWVPVYWDDALQQVGAVPELVTVYGDPDRDTLLGFEVDGQPVWPSGRRRRVTPRGRERELPDARGAVSLARQARVDVTGAFAAPLIGVLWAYIDGSGPAGAVFATVVAAGLLFWLPSVYGSDPT